jgi:hypothetical protein
VTLCIKVTGHLHVTSASHPSVCLSPECVKVAATILSDMDMKADPCKDFYQVSDVFVTFCDEKNRVGFNPSYSEFQGFRS